MPELVATDKFVVRTIKSLATSPLNEWANSYEFQSDDPVSLGELSVLATAVVQFEAALHHDVVAFKRVLVSSWEEDSKPYNPAVFLTIPLALAGNVGPTADLLPLNQCLSVARTPDSGRLGHLFYRGVLGEDQVSAPAGIAVLTDPSEIDDAVQAALASSELENYIGSTPLGPIHMVMINKAGSQVRPVISLVAQGVATLPTDHAWFNRTTSP